MSAVFLLSAGKASHMKPRNRIDLIMLVYKSKIKHLTNQPNNMTISINKISWKNLKDIFMYDLIFSILVFPVILNRTFRLLICVKKTFNLVKIHIPHKRNYQNNWNNKQSCQCYSKLAILRSTQQNNTISNQEEPAKKKRDCNHHLSAAVFISTSSQDRNCLNYIYL